jgi:hypothetical protein
MDVDGVAHAPVWLQEVMSKDVLVRLLELSPPGGHPEPAGARRAAYRGPEKDVEGACRISIGCRTSL